MNRLERRSCGHCQLHCTANCTALPTALPTWQFERVNLKSVMTCRFIMGLPYLYCRPSKNSIGHMWTCFGWGRWRLWLIPSDMYCLYCCTASYRLCCRYNRWDTHGNYSGWADGAWAGTTPSYGYHPTGYYSSGRGRYWGRGRAYTGGKSSSW